METKESYFTAQSLRVLFQEMSLEKIFNFLKEITIFSKSKVSDINLGYIYFYAHFKSGFKNMFIYVLADTYF